MEHTAIALMMLTFLITCVDTLSYAVRLNAVKSGQFALSTSLFNVFVLITRTANNLLQPLVGAMIGAGIIQHVNPVWHLREVIFAATLGACFSCILIPTFLRLFQRAVSRLEVVGSVPALLLQSLSLSNIKRIRKAAALPNRRSIQSIRFGQMPRALLFLNIVVTGVYTVGFLAANYAATMVDRQHELAVANSSGMINGIATILLTLLIDPRSAIITDQAMRGQRPYGDVKGLVAMLIGTKILGTLFGQLMFVPAAEIIASIYR